jgi:energy-coupling factor transporter ATP-binding protein EcfA2
MIEITLIIGDSDQGKSTLVRCLTGKSQDMHQHTHPKNVVPLDWVLGKSLTKTYETLVLISSLNEGRKYTTVGVKAYQSLAGVVAVHPADLEDMLDDYDSLKITSTKEDSLGKVNSPKKAILCISSSVNNTVRYPRWTLADYHNVMTDPIFAAQYPVTNVVHVGKVTIGHALIWPNPMVPRHALAPIIVPGPLVAANTVAQAARTPIGLV